MSVSPRDLRFLIMAPAGRDNEITKELLNGAGIEAETFIDIESLLVALREGAAAALIAEEHLTGEAKAPLSHYLAQQPQWSDVPILILTRPGADSPDSAEAWRTLGNVTLLERPTRVTTLVSAAQTAIRARTRQYQIRGHLADRLKTEQALRSADRRKDEFLATLGHELRNPLAPIMNSLEILKLSGAFDNPRTVQACAVMERQVHHLNRLVDDLLEVSRITRGIIEVKKESLDLNAILRAAIETSRPVLDNLRHQLIEDLTTEVICVAGDPVRLTQVFANLLNNAAKFTVGRENAQIDIGFRTENDGTVFVVSDNGVGIAAGKAERAFLLFEKLEPQSEGTGIGLTLVRRVVQAHGGRVWIESEGEGLGTRVCFTIPSPRQTPDSA